MSAGGALLVRFNMDACCRRHAVWSKRASLAQRAAQPAGARLAALRRAAGGSLLAGSAALAAVGGPFAPPPAPPGAGRAGSTPGTTALGGAAAGGQTLVRLGSTLRLAGLERAGRLPASQQLSLDIVLRPTDSAGLARLANAVSTPGSPEFHDPISLAAFAEHFGAPPEEVGRAEAELRADGLRGLALAPDGLVLTARTTVAGADRAFGVTLYRYADARTGHLAGWASATGPLLPSNLAAGTSAIVGLDSLEPPQPAGLVLVGGARRSDSAPAAACPAAAGDGLTPGQLASAYGLDELYDDPTPDLGASSTVALVEFAPYVASDVTAFASCYGLSGGQVSSTAVDGGAPSDPQGSIEADLDVEELLSLAPRTSIRVLEAPNTDAGSLDAFTKAIDGGADVVATSWGLCEPALDPGVAAAENELFEQAATLGVSVVAASGDDGSEDCTASLSQPGLLAVDDPSSQPYVTGVGGTTLSLSPRVETAWNSGGYAGGGGISSDWPIPDYQSASATPAGSPAPGVINAYSSGTPCKASAGDCREVPDVSANAGSPFGIYTTVSGAHDSGGGWVGVEGTSGAAPIWAALFALADSSVACDGKRVGFANPDLYAIAAGGAAGAALTDITAGDGVTDNSTDASFSSLYPVTPGYDMASGLGSPLAGDGLGEQTDDGLVSQLCQGAVASGSTPAGHAAPQSSSSAGSGSASATPPSTSTGEPPAGPNGGSSTATRRAEHEPVLARLVPARGPAAGGTPVLLRGAHLAGTVAVWFGPRRALLEAVISPGEVRVLAPPGHGAVTVRLRTRYGTASSRVVRYAYAAAATAPAGSSGQSGPSGASRAERARAG